MEKKDNSFFYIIKHVYYDYSNKMQYYVTQCDYTLLLLKRWLEGHELIKMFRVLKNANKDISLRTHTCTSYLYIDVANHTTWLLLLWIYHKAGKAFLPSQ